MIYGIKPRAFLQSSSEAIARLMQHQSVITASPIPASVADNRCDIEQQALKTHMHRHMVPGAAGSV